ncbi:MAG: hypothetical protein AB7I12_05475 [Steroidobacteraceae bacterium]
MSQLFRMFVDIAVWRRGPQDLPASITLAWLVAAIYAFASGVQVSMMGWDFRPALLLVLMDLALQAAWLWGLLAFFARRARFLQTITAFLGVAALLTLMDVLMSAIMRLLGASDSANPWPLLHLGLVLLLLGRVLQQALERSLLLSMALTLTIMLSISVVARNLMPGM